MRIRSFAVVAACLALLAPAAASAKPYFGDTGYKASYKSSYKKKGKRYGKKSGHRHARRSGGGGSASTGCLSSEARNLLGRIQSQFGSVQVISTCRPGARIATSGRPSKHASGQAVDFRVPGRKAEVVNWLIANHRSGGTMTYRDMDHIHVDVGGRFVALNRNSGRG